MATKIELTSGSIFAGNPITFDITPNNLISTPSFHRVIVEVICGLSGNNYETIKLNAPIAIENNKVNIDVASAIRVPLDAYEYTPEVTTYPFVSWNLKVYDEYMDSNGGVFTNQGILYFPKEDEYYRSIAGSFSDMERLLATQCEKNVITLSRKPTSSSHIAVVGEIFAYTPPYQQEQSLQGSGSLDAPTSEERIISAEGVQLIGNQKLFVLPEGEATKRQIFRFINGFGVLESISVPCAYSKTLAITSTPYTISRQETFSNFSRATIKKTNNQESWLFTTDPLTEEWLHWYLHEFLMSEHIWMQVKGTWLPITITPEEKITFLDKTNTNMYSVSFTVELDINGSPILTI